MTTRANRNSTHPPREAAHLRTLSLQSSRISEERTAELGGAGALGLDEANANAAFEALLGGRAPDGTKLVRNAGAKDRRMGWDLTPSVGKSVSILFAAASEAEQLRILEAHHRATDAMLDYIKAQLISRTGAQGKGPAAAAGDGVIIRRVDHLDSRDGDPQLHSHCVLINAARGPDGKWRTMDERALFDHKHAAGSIYRHRLARELRALGYGIESERERDADGRETGQVWHRVAGVGEAEMRHFSKRRQAIEAYMAATGATAQAATMQTRRGKSDENEPAHIIETARAAMADLRRKGVIEWEHSGDLLGMPSQGLGPRSGADLLADLHRTDSAFDRRHVIDRLAKERLDVADPVQAADQCLAGWEALGAIVRLTDDTEGRARWCTKVQWDMEEAITQDAAARKDETTHRLPGAMVDAAIAAHEKAQGFALTDEQRRAVYFVACESGGVACLSGQAGTGKTATAGAYLGAFKAAGFQLIGTSTAQRAAEKLEAETGMASMSCAKLLSAIERGELTLTPTTVLAVDEAGMVGAKTLRQIQQAADRTGAKLLLLGDALQLQPIEAGAPFRLVAQELGEAKLTEIRRQKQDADREIARAFYEGASGATIVERWEAREQLHTRNDKAGAIEALTRDVLDNPRPLSEKLIVANTRADCAAIAHALRQGLIDRGELREGVSIEVAGKLAGQREALDVREGERVLFQKNDKRLGVANGDVGVVEAITTDKRGRVALTVRLESEIPGKHGKRLIVRPETYERLGYAYASTTHAAQGQGKESVYWLASPGQGLDRNMGLVAFTRTKGDFAAYASTHDKARLVERLDAWGTKQAARELAPKAEQAETAQKVASVGAALGAALVELKEWRAKREKKAAKVQRLRLAGLQVWWPKLGDLQTKHDIAEQLQGVVTKRNAAEAQRLRLVNRLDGYGRQAAAVHERMRDAEHRVSRAQRRREAADAKVQAWKAQHPIRVLLGWVGALETLRAERKAEAKKAREAANVVKAERKGFAYVEDELRQITVHLEVAGQRVKTLDDERDRLTEQLRPKAPAVRDSAPPTDERRGSAISKRLRLSPPWPTLTPKRRGGPWN